MREYDSVELLVQKEAYAKHGVHKGMQGWISYEKCVEGYSLVEFPLYGEAGIIATIDVLDKDLKMISDWNARINAQLKAEHEGKK